MTSSIQFIRKVHRLTACVNNGVRKTRAVFFDDAAETRPYLCMQLRSFRACEGFSNVYGKFSRKHNAMYVAFSAVDNESTL